LPLPPTSVRSFFGTFVLDSFIVCVACWRGE